jgi:catechol 2,3-dioxygenase-like lactoylglutathione lyase family enzyme
MANQQPLGPLGPDVAVTHILVVTDPARSRDFWVDVLGAELYREYGGTSVVLRLAGTWLLLVSGFRGAAFLTPPHDWGSEIRCFLRDPDGHLVEISQSKAS